MNKAAPVISVIGGGASGMMAAIWAKRTALKTGMPLKVCIYESNPRLGKKITATGNGRCNLTNIYISQDNYRGSAELFGTVYPQFDNLQLLEFFRGIGLYTRTDSSGRVYPLSNQASSVLDSLRYEVEKLGIEVITETKITDIDRKNKGYILNGVYYSDICIFAGGGKAYPVFGSDGNLFPLLQKHGIKITDTFPALTAIEIKDFKKSLKGIRAEGKISVKSNGRLLASAQGELQYTEYGLSGIPTMQISRCVSEMLSSDKKADITLTVDSVPSLSNNDVKAYLEKQLKTNSELPCEMLLSGLIPKKLGTFLLSELSIKPEKPIKTIHPAVVEKIVAALKSEKYKAKSVRGFNDAQVTAGGVDAEEINKNTLGLLKMPGTFVCGELVDVDGDCGGYNLQWAFSSGYVAGVNAAKEISKC